MFDFDAVQKHFQSVDPTLARLMAAVLKDTKRPLSNPIKAPVSDYTLRLYTSIVSQQISTKAADKILERFFALVGDPKKAGNILKHSIDELRSVGLSRQKASYIRSIAELTGNSSVRVDHLDTLSDEEVIDELTKIYGVGRWTAEMFLMFTLARPDVFSSGDLGLLNAAKRLYGQPDITRQELALLSERWTPHRTTAALVLWHSLDNKPV